jgi:hypothetical protein
VTSSEFHLGCCLLSFANYLNYVLFYLPFLYFLEVLIQKWGWKSWFIMEKPISVETFLLTVISKRQLRGLSQFLGLRTLLAKLNQSDCFSIFTFVHWSDSGTSMRKIRLRLKECGYFQPWLKYFFLKLVPIKQMLLLRNNVSLLVRDNILGVFHWPDVRITQFSGFPRNLSPDSQLTSTTLLVSMLHFHLVPIFFHAAVGSSKMPWSTAPTSLISS